MAGVRADSYVVHLSFSCFFYVQFRATFPPNPIPSQSLEQIVQLKHQEPDGHVSCIVVCKHGVHNQSVEQSCSISSPPLYPSLSWCQGQGVVWVDLQPRPTQVLQVDHLTLELVDLQEVPLIRVQEGRDPKVAVLLDTVDLQGDHLTQEPEVFQEALLIQALEGLQEQLELLVDHPTPQLEVFQEAHLIQALEVFQEALPTQELEDHRAVTRVLHRQEANMEM